MSRNTHTTGSASEPTPEHVAQLLDVVADHTVDHALSGIEDAIARLRADAEQAATARDIIRSASPSVLREALRLRAARTKAIG